MRHRPAFLLLSLFVLITNFSGESITVIRRTVSEVQMTVVATDQQGRVVENISPADIAVLEDDRRISNFELRSASDLPLRVAIVLDASDSNLPNWVSTKAAVGDFLRLTLKVNDQALLVAFDSRVELERVIDDPQQVETLMTISRAGGQTALYDTLYTTCQNAVFNDFREPRRSALIVFSDGKDNLSWHSLDQIIEKAEMTGIAVYTISVHDRKLENPGDGILHSLAEKTGGDDFTVTRPGELRESLMKISEELRSSYVLYYHPPTETGQREFRRVRVLSLQDKGPVLRHKRGYFTGSTR